MILGAVLMAVLCSWIRAVNGPWSGFRGGVLFRSVRVSNSKVSATNRNNPHHLSTVLLAGIAGACVSIPRATASASAQLAIDYAAVQAHTSAPARFTGRGARGRATHVQGSAWRGDGVTPKETRQMKRMAARINAKKAPKGAGA